MANETAYSTILNKIIDYKEDVNEHLASGGAKTMEEYSLLVGEYRCLRRLQEDILDIEKRFIND